MESSNQINLITLDHHMGNLQSIISTIVGYKMTKDKLSQRDAELFVATILISIAENICGNEFKQLSTELKDLMDSSFGENREIVEKVYKILKKYGVIRNEININLTRQDNKVKESGGGFII